MKTFPLIRREPNEKTQAEALVYLHDVVERLLTFAPLRAICYPVLADVRFRTWPAAASYHHAHEYGLVIHTAEVMSAALAAAEALPRVERHVLVVAALWHDFLKTEEYSPDFDRLVPAMSKIRVLPYAEQVGHIVGGYATFMAQAAQNEVPPAMADRIGHCLLAHHGRREWGSPVEPRTLEAMLLHQADMVSVLHDQTK